MPRRLVFHLLALTLPACIWLAAASADESRFEVVECPLHHATAQCGVAHLPENREGGGGEVQVFIAILGAENDTTPAVILGGGGPGGDLFMEEEGGFDFWDDYRQNILGAEGKLILMDQRGAGLSRPQLSCPEEKPLYEELLSQPLSPEEEAKHYNAVLHKCLRRLRADGIEVTAYTTTAAADDVEDIRRLLGIDQWHLIGFSYGTRLALEVMRRHPDGVASALLDSAFPYDFWQQDPPYPFADAMEKIAADCARQAHCLRHGDVLANIDKAMQLAEKKPLRLRTQYEGTTYDLALTPDRLLSLLHLGIYEETGVAVLPFFSRQLAQGEVNTPNARYFAQRLLELLFDERWASMLNTVISCQESPPPTADPTTPLRQYEYEGGQLFLTTCDSLWGAPPLPQLPVASDIPVLLISGVYDPTTPPAWASQLAARLPNAQHLVVPASHTPSVLFPCLHDAAYAFFGSPSATISHLCDNETLTFH